MSKIKYSHEEEIALIHAIQKVFPEAYCTGISDGYCIVWPTETAPIVAKGTRPRKAWANAAKRIKGKNKEALERLRKKILKEEIKRGQYGVGY